MVGGGPGSNIGETHRYALRLDGRYTLVAGVFARDEDRSDAFAATLGIEPDRRYRDARAMVAAEARRDDRVDLVVIATPNDSHYELTKLFLEAGFHVVCEKPLTNESSTSEELVRLAEREQLVLAIPHCYSSYAMVRQAARMVRDGDLGRLTMIDVEHASGWAATNLEASGHKQASWRTDPAVAGVMTVVSDLGTHAFHLARFISGLEAEAVSSHLSTVVPGRRTYDNATVNVRWTNGVTGRVWASMVATGHLHGLRIRVFGERGNIEWQHESPHHLLVQDSDGRVSVLTQGMSTLSDDATRLNRVGAGHPEGFLEAFANFYLEVADEIEARRASASHVTPELSFPTGVDGRKGLEFVENVQASHDAGGTWILFNDTPGDE